ncbi:MAG: S8 family serine peptidase [Actinomycetota bacterium]
MLRRFSSLLLALLLLGWTPALAARGDTLFSEQWALGKIEAERAWAKSRGEGVVVAVVDSGVDFGHPDLKGKSAGSWNCVGVSDDTQDCRPGGEDDVGHGTAVAGVAAAMTGNGEGIAGVAPDAKIMSVKVLSSEGTGSIPDIARGVKWAADQGAEVINLSLGPENILPLLDLIFGDSRKQFQEEFQEPVDYATGKGALVVAAAGNDGEPSYFAGMEHVYVVGATGPDDEVAFYSSTDPNVYAPGGDDKSTFDCSEGGSERCILTTKRGGTYGPIQGTSFAAPHVSGVAALLMSAGLKNETARDRMDQSADSIRGGKRINAARAVGAGAVAAAPPAAGGIAPEAPTRPPAARKSGAANPAPASPAGGGGGAKASVPAAVPPAELSAPAPPPASPGEQSEEASPQKIRVLPIASSLAEDRELDERTQLLAVFRLGIVAALIWGYVWMRRRFVRHPG